MQPVFPIAPHFQLTLVRLLFYFPGIPAIQQVFHTMDLRNFLHFFDLIVQSLVVSMRFDITDNSQGNREFRSFHIDEHLMQERIGIMCIVNQDIFFSDTVFTDFDHFQLT